MTSLLAKLFNYVIFMTGKYNIDESHGIGHSMKVLNYANCIYEDEVKTSPILKDHENIIYISAIVHDMCDKKYMNEDEGLRDIESFLDKKIENFEMDAIKKIITTMSYSSIKKNGFPELGIYNTAYHIVREADLLSAYDFDRCMIYHMKMNDPCIDLAYENAFHLFENRVLKHHDHQLFITDYSKKEGEILRNTAINRINSWNRIIKNTRIGSK
jgi:HD superfamily phosphodiesterase